MSNLADSTLIGSLGGILAGISELLLAIGAGIGFVIRSRRNARQTRIRTENAASLAAQEAKRVLEEKLERQHDEQLEQLRGQNVELQKMFAMQVSQYETQIKDLRDQNKNLLNRILRNGNHDREN